MVSLLSATPSTTKMPLPPVLPQQRRSMAQTLDSFMMALDILALGRLLLRYVMLLAT